MKKMNFEQMEVINGGQAVSAAGGDAILTEDPAIRLCVVGAWVTGIGLMLLGFGVPFASPAAAAGFGIIAGATQIFC